MACLTYETNSRRGFRLREYELGNARRRYSVWLGDIPEREAETIKRHVEAVRDARKMLVPVPVETSRWIASLDAELAERLAPLLGLQRTVAQSIDEYLAWSSRNNKQSTAESQRGTLQRVARRFGSRPLGALSGRELDDWLAGLNVSQSTVGKHAKHVRAWLHWCEEQGWITAPQVQTPTTVAVGDKRCVTQAEFDRLVAAFADDVEMATALQVIRWTGLRVPSELLSLRWGSIDWESRSLSIFDAKRSKRSSRGPPIYRQVPLFPPLAKALQHYSVLRWSTDRPPTDPLFPEIVRRGGNGFCKRVRRVRDSLGLDWPKLFNALRATRETELIERFGVKAASEWIGNSPAVASRNYEMVSRETWDAALMAESQ